MMSATRLPKLLSLTSRRDKQTRRMEGSRMSWEVQEEGGAEEEEDDDEDENDERWDDEA